MTEPSESLREAVAAALRSRQEKQFQADMDLIGHLDWDLCQALYRRPVSGVTVMCGRPSTWRMFCRGCGLLGMTCGTCRDKFLTSTTHVICRVCRQRATILTGWAFEPIGAGS